jgi:transcriptional regulator of arginine metabolism
LIHTYNIELFLQIVIVLFKNNRYIAIFRLLLYIFTGVIHIFVEQCVKERLARLDVIRKLIKTEKIKSQDTLLEHLQKKGFAATQATLSRDLKALKVGKISDSLGSYVYTLPGGGENPETERTYIPDFLRGYISIDWSGNIVVIKTHSGHSDPVAVALDKMGIDEILGTIAGNDNTVAVFLREGVNGKDFVKRLKEIIPELD